MVLITLVEYVFEFVSSFGQVGGHRVQNALFEYKKVTNKKWKNCDFLMEYG